MAKWTNKTFIAKAITVVSLTLLVTLGLCGINFALVMYPPPSSSPDGLYAGFVNHLPVVAWVEAGVLGLCVVLMVLLGIASLFTGRKPPAPPPDAGMR